MLEHTPLVVAVVDLEIQVLMEMLQLVELVDQVSL